MVLRSATALRGALEGVGPENRDFFGPWNGTSEASAIWAQKSQNHYVPRHKNNRYIHSYNMQYTVMRFSEILWLILYRWSLENIAL
jgi:hypothetical protein